MFCGVISYIKCFVFNHFGDRIMFSEIGKYDTFPNTNFIDVTVGDGEDYVRLESFGDRLLCFKQRTLQILNVKFGHSLQTASLSL